MANKKRMTETSVDARMWGKRNSHTLPVGKQNGAALWKTVWQFLKKLNMGLPYSLAIPLLSIYPREIKMCIHPQTYTRMFIESSVVITAKKGKQPKCQSAKGWRNKAGMSHTMEHYSATRRNEDTASARRNRDSISTRKKPGTKVTFVPCPDWAKPQRQKVGNAEIGTNCLMQRAFEGDENLLALDSGVGCTTLGSIQNH